MLIVLFVGPLKVPLVNAKDVQLRERRENFCLKIFCLKISPGPDHGPPVE